MNKKLLRERSALIYVLIALIPYSKPNLLLAYKPALFFRELEKISNYKKTALKNAYYRGVNNGLISTESKQPKLTTLGERKIAPFTATKLGKKARLMIIFDIPEKRAQTRQTLRNTLKIWGFQQVQKSVWTSEYDYKELLVELTDELELRGCVEVYECLKLHSS